MAGAQMPKPSVRALLTVLAVPAVVVLATADPSHPWARPFAQPTGRAAAVATPAAPNSDATYQQLRTVAVGTEAITVNNLVFKRDAGTFTLRSGKVCFLSPVGGKVTGAVFEGDGSFTLAPP